MTKFDNISQDSSDERENGNRTDRATTSPLAGRREVLKMGAALGSVGAMSAITSGSAAATLQAGSVPDGNEFDNLVGAYYYGWYAPEKGRHWDGDIDTIGEDDRGEPDRFHEPVLGEYSSHDQETVDQHIAWALNHGINWFNCTWWGPDTNSDETIRDYLLESRHADKMHFSVLYEPWGRDIGGWSDFGDPEIRETLRNDMQYFEQEFFNDPNWLHIDGRPVVYFWRNHTFSGDVEGAFEEAFSTIDSEPYLIGDRSSHAEPFDAFANFATVGKQMNDWDSYIANSRDRRVAHKKVGEYGTDQLYIPSVQPGASWMWPDSILEHDESKFREACQVMAEAMDDDVSAAIVCTFNEWHEGSALEPAREYGTSALEVVEDELQGAPANDTLLEEEYARVRFEFNGVKRPTSDDDRPLSFWVDEVRLEADDGSVIMSDEITPTTGTGYQTDPGMSGALGRWIGSPLGTGSLIFKRSDLEQAETLVLTGHGMDIPDHAADVFVNGKSMGTHDVGTGNRDYEFPIPDDIPDHPDAPEEQEPYNGPHSVPGVVEAEHFDTGGEGIAYHDTTGDHYGGDYRSDEAVDVQSASEHGQNVGWIEQGEWLEYTVEVAGAGDYDLSARVASHPDMGGGSLSVSAGGESVSTSFDATDGWQSWTTVDLGTLSLPAGETTIRVEMTDGGWNFNYLEFTDAGGDSEGVVVVDDTTAKLVWKPDFEINWPGYVYARPSINGDPQSWQQMDETSDSVFETTLSDLSAGDEIQYNFAYYEGGWQYTERTTETFQPDGPGEGGSGPETKKLVRGETATLRPGEYLESANGEYRLYFQQGDGNLVLRDTSTGDARWASGTAGDGGTRLPLQGDGNLVMYTDSGDSIWASDTAGSGANELVLEDDGTLVLYADGSEVWSVNS